jgi:tetratricopeptide (TPR) repeat protein
MAVDRQAAEALYDEGLDLLAAGEWRRAAQCFRASFAADPALLDARHGLVRALRDGGAFDDGILAAKALAEIAPEDALAYTALSILYQHKGLIAEAEEASTRAKLLDWKRQLREGKQQRASL